MGAFTSSQQVADDDNDMSMPSQYRYPPKSGKYFSSHFIMGGEKFETPQPETFLFGENSDLNFLSNRPALFPYPLPQTNEPTRAIQVLINVRKESIRFVPAPSKENSDSQKRIQNESATAGTPATKKLSTFNIEFTFDCDVDCDISIHYFCTEELTSTSVILHSRDSTINSDVYHYQKGGNQVFCQMDHIFDPSKYSNEDLVYRVDKEVIPVAIFCATTNEYNGFRQFQTTIAIVEKKADGVYDLKALKQKHFIDGLNCLLQEMYGIENKKTIEPEFDDDDNSEDNGYECVICMSELRDTIILPCRHLCLCNQCANSLRYQSNNCPICRAPFRALLYVKALKKNPSPTVSATSAPLTSCTSHDSDIPEGYAHVPLMEALNGPAVQKSNSKAAIYEKMSRHSFQRRNVEEDDDSVSCQSIRAQAVYPSIDRVKKGHLTNKRNRVRAAHQRTSDSVLAEFSNRSDTQLDLTGDFTNSDLEISKHFVRSLSIRSENNPKRASHLNEELKKSANSESQPIIMVGKDEEDLSFETTNGTPKKRLMSSVPDTPTSYFSMRSSTNSSSSTNQLLTTATPSANDKK